MKCGVGKLGALVARYRRLWESVSPLIFILHCISFLKRGTAIFMLEKVLTSHFLSNGTFPLMTISEKKNSSLIDDFCGC